MIRCLLALLLAGLPALASAAPVDAAEHRAFWLWAGVRSQPLPADTHTLYLLQGEVRGQPLRLQIRSAGIPAALRAGVWLVYRSEGLDWSPALYQQLRQRLQQWRQAGHRVIGVQIDFDAPTRQLDRYASFLQQLRRELPADCQLGVTGLLDWANADPQALNALAGSLDEVVLQTYQGRRTVPGYQNYLARLQQLRLPFRIGLVQGGDWQPRHDPAESPWFRGYVVFLLNPSGIAQQNPTQ